MKYVTPKLLLLMFFLVAWFILSPYLFASFTLVLPRAGAKGKGYGTFHEEAVRVFSSLLEQEAIADPIPVIQGILQTCQDLKPLRDEVGFHRGLWLIL